MQLGLSLSLARARCLVGYISLPSQMRAHANTQHHQGEKRHACSLSVSAPLCLPPFVAHTHAPNLLKERENEGADRVTE